MQLDYSHYSDVAPLPATQRPAYAGGVRDTSRAAFHEGVRDMTFATMGDRIVHHMRDGTTRTRAEIAKALGISTSTMSGRINDLLQHGRLIEEPGRFTCQVTGRKVRGVSLA